MINKGILDEKYTDLLWCKFSNALAIGKQFDPMRVALSIASIYVSLGLLWILLSDKITSMLASDKETLAFISMIKGWVYVLITGGLVTALIYIALKRIKKMEEELIKSYENLTVAHDELIASEEEIKQQYEELLIYRNKLHRLAYNDPLTGLPNRILFYEDLERHLEKSPHVNMALFFIDVDNFKFINDTLGHFFGDRLIMTVGERVSSMLEVNHTVYRLGGDEFIVCLHDYSSIEEVEESAEKINLCFIEPFMIESSTLHVTASIGVALYPEHGMCGEELLKSADIAMYRAKEAGKNRFVFYNRNMNEAVTERMMVEKHLRTALEKHEFQIYYQPQLDIKTGKVTGFEALLRWQNPQMGLVSPAKFIKVAEDTRLIIPIGEWVLRNACYFIKSFHKQGYTDLAISVNISMLQLLQDNFADTVIQILELVDLEPQFLELEITESILMESYEAIGGKLEQLRRKGVKIALDDFGQGYSSLSYLKQLPITTLKIDKTFIDSILDEKPENSLAGIIVTMGRKMGLMVLAEGVETEEQLEYLTRHRCHKIQGYFFSKPLMKEEAERLIQKSKQENVSL